MTINTGHTINTGPMAQRHLFRCCGCIELEGDESQSAKKILKIAGNVYLIYFRTGARYLGDLQITTTRTPHGVLRQGRPDGKGCYFDPRSNMYYAGGFRAGKFDGWGARGWLFGASRLLVEIGQFRQGQPVDINFLHDAGTQIDGYRLNHMASRTRLQAQQQTVQIAFQVHELTVGSRTLLSQCSAGKIFVSTFKGPAGCEAYYGVTDGSDFFGRKAHDIGVCISKDMLYAGNIRIGCPMGRGVLVRLNQGRHNQDDAIVADSFNSSRVGDYYHFQSALAPAPVVAPVASGSVAPVDESDGSDEVEVPEFVPFSPPIREHAGAAALLPAPAPVVPVALDALVIESGGSDEFGIPPYSAPAPPTDVAPVAVLPPAPADEYAGAAALPPAPTPLPQLFDCFEYKDKKSCEMKFTSGGLETNPTRKKIKLVSENGLSLAVDLVMSEGEVYILQIHFDGEDFVVDEKSIKYEKDGSELSFTALEVDEQNGILAHIFGVLAQNQKFFQPYSLQFARAATLPLPPAALPPAPAEEYADGAALPPPPPAALPPAPAGEYADGAALPPPPPAALPLAPAGAYADGAALPSPPVAPVARPVAEVPAFINPDMIERAAANTSGSFTNEYDNSDSGSESEWAVVGNPDDYSARSGILVNPVNHSAV